MQEETEQLQGRNSDSILEIFPRETMDCTHGDVPKGIRHYTSSFSFETNPGLSNSHIGTDDLQRSITTICGSSSRATRQLTFIAAMSFS